MLTERWPPVYDAEDLKQTISLLVSPNGSASQLYCLRSQPTACQGDVFELDSSVPLIHEDGKPATKGDFKYWLVIGNTCDISRSLEEVEYSQIVPIHTIEGHSVTSDQRKSFLTYAYSRRFYLPPWEGIDSEAVFFADFTTPVTVHKNVIQDLDKRKATLSHHGWILLHSCLVRFLARDDGRYD
ncbi:hypothetical protein [Glaciecola sp. SC05]|uniref:hypothetical protein n=1 Tax=Glaciecola sp. SC05 TaxID=1987355 RepID=UPI00352908FF